MSVENEVSSQAKCEEFSQRKSTYIDYACHDLSLLSFWGFVVSSDEDLQE